MHPCRGAVQSRGEVGGGDDSGKRRRRKDLDRA